MARCGGTGSAEAKERKKSGIAEEKHSKFSKSLISYDHCRKSQKTDLDLSFAKETIGLYFQRAILALDSLWFDFSFDVRRMEDVLSFF